MMFLDAIPPVAKIGIGAVPLLMRGRRGTLLTLAGGALAGLGLIELLGGLRQPFENMAVQRGG